ESAAQAERRLADLAAAERRLRATLDSADLGLGMADLDGRWMQANEPLVAVLGRTNDDLVQTTVAEVTAEKDRPAVVDALALLRNGDLVRWEADVSQARPDGTEVQVGMLIVKL
ncbi:MAG: PAS domain S-box protein, partial [Chloroflexi bacterium]